MILSLEFQTYSVCKIQDQLLDCIFEKSLSCLLTCILHFTAFTGIKCMRPLSKQNAIVYLPDGVKSTSKYDVGIEITYECLPSYWIYARYSIMGWVFSGTRSVRLTCSKSGNWQPHDFTFTCAGCVLYLDLPF